MEARPTAGVGPRLPGRITAELILRSPQYMSCIKQYEIDLRGEQDQLDGTLHQSLFIYIVLSVRR